MVYLESEFLMGGRGELLGMAYQSLSCFLKELLGRLFMVELLQEPPRQTMISLFPHIPHNQLHLLLRPNLRKQKNHIKLILPILMNIDPGYMKLTLRLFIINVLTELLVCVKHMVPPVHRP